MDKATCFLTGRYLARDLPYYRGLARGCFKVAVDGGYRFFLRSGMVPDLLIGDFDSLKRLPKKLSARTKVLTYPVNKDKTDTELAVDQCIERGAKSIDIVEPSIGEPDHFLANLFLLTRRCVSLEPKAPKMRLVGPAYEAFFLQDSGIRFSGARGSIVSIIPVSDRIRLTCRGTAFDISGVRISRGETRPARNRIMAARADFQIVGQAFVVRLVSRR
ncbi:MAG: thiamine diphosphokinase [Candidatus Zixiibacteriota bacterium]